MHEDGSERLPRLPALASVCPSTPWTTDHVNVFIYYFQSRRRFTVLQNCAVLREPESASITEVLIRRLASYQSISQVGRIFVATNMHSRGRAQ
jgi:hypothetical protein